MASAKTATLAKFGLGAVALTALSLAVTTLSPRTINFVPVSGTSTGVVIQVNGTTQWQVFSTSCTNTGGLAKYPTCYVRSPLATTGALTAVSLECGNTNKVLSMSGGFVKSSTEAVASGFKSLRTVSVGTGSISVFNARTLTGSITTWNPADVIKFQTVTAFPAGGIDCVVRAELYDKYGS